MLIQMFTYTILSKSGDSPAAIEDQVSQVVAWC